MATTDRHNITVCICTFKRPAMLKRLLEKVIEQETEGLFTYSIVVVDNDQLHTAEGVTSEFADKAKVPIIYDVEPRQNICLARNRAIERASGSFVAFVDDDEFPDKRWLVALYKTCQRYDVPGVLGPVNSYFDEKPPDWVLKGKFYERPTHVTGFVIDWKEGRTGNVLLKKELLDSSKGPFDPEFHRGGDTDFFRRMIEQGHKFVWCDEAPVYEVVSPVRWTRSFMLTRALMRGAITLQNPNSGTGSVLKSMLAVVAYTAALPFTLLLGHHRFMDILIRLCDHLGKVLAVAGINPVRSPYATD